MGGGPGVVDAEEVDGEVRDATPVGPWAVSHARPIVEDDLDDLTETERHDRQIVASQSKRRSPIRTATTIVARDREGDDEELIQHEWCVYGQVPVK